MVITKSNHYPPIKTNVRRVSKLKYKNFFLDNFISY
jgi:hypothetical protein